MQVREISFIRYAYQGLALNEFKGATNYSPKYDNGELAPFPLQGDDFLGALGIAHHTVGHCALMLAVLTAAFNLLAYLQARPGRGSSPLESPRGGSELRSRTPTTTTTTHTHTPHHPHHTHPHLLPLLLLLTCLLACPQLLRGAPKFLRFSCRAASLAAVEPKAQPDV